MATLFAGLAFVLFGVATVAYGVACAVKAVASVRWPRVSGVITQFQVRRAAGVDGDSLQGFDLAYQFSAGESTRTGFRTYYGDAFLLPMSFVSAENRPRYAVGQAVEVSYAPDEPDQCVLRPGVQRELVAILCVGAAFGILGVLLLLTGT